MATSFGRNGETHTPTSPRDRGGGAIAVDFLNAAGNSADVNIAIAATGNAACPVECTITFPPTSATRS
jgi:hypothetical protein